MLKRSVNLLRLALSSYVPPLRTLWSSGNVNSGGFSQSAGGGIRTHGGLVHQVLSLTPLAAREPPPAPIPYNPNRIKTLPAHHTKTELTNTIGPQLNPRHRKPCQPSTSTSLAAGESTGGPSETCDAIASPTSDVVELPPMSAVLILPSEST